VGLLTRIRAKNFDRWLPGYGRHLARKLVHRPPTGLRHLLFAVCDHFEPLVWDAMEARGVERVRRWREGYPQLCAGFRDADGRPPQHSFFFPGEEYRPAFFDMIDELVEDGLGEVELHLHHEGATEETMRADVLDYLATYAARGHLSRLDGKLRYAFIHGDWALANARPDGTACGVDSELELLFDTGCYADFTFPSCPDVSQPNMVNQIYWPTGDLRRRRAYEGGVPARVGVRHDDRILMITGPLAFSMRDSTLKPRLEYGALTAHDPATPSRVANWVAQSIGVAGRPEWVFVKVYTHGADEPQAASLLGNGGHTLHEVLTRQYNDGTSWKLHYVTAREMYNIAIAAMEGLSGDPNAYRDHVLPPPPIRQNGAAHQGTAHQGTKT
jgi:hypothetical protein